MLLLCTESERRPIVNNELAVSTIIAVAVIVSGEMVLLERSGVGG